MNIYVSQIYVEVGVTYPFSHYFQQHLGEQLSKEVKMSAEFAAKYGEDFNLIFRMSARRSLSEPEIKGPTVFKRDKDVEYSVFLPFFDFDVIGEEAYSRALHLFLEQVITVLKLLKVDMNGLSERVDCIVNEILSNPRMFESG